MQWTDMVGYLLLFGMLATVATTMVFITVNSANKDSQKMTMSQIQSMGIANFFLIGAFGIMASYYLEANPQMFQRYVLFMLHGALFLGIMAVSVASLQQLS